MNGNWLAPARVILNNEVQSSDAATKIVKLPLSNYLHTLYVKVQATNGATSALNQDITDVVDLIEVIANGSDVLVSLTPAELKRWCLWWTGKNLPQSRNERPGAVQEMVFPLFFGRAPYDPNFYLRCAALTDLELKVTYSPTIAATSFATGTVTIGVFAVMTMGNQPGDYLGTLTHKTLKAFTSAAAGDDQTLIPRGNLLRQLMVYAYEAAIEDGVDITNVKFDLNNDEQVRVNASWLDLNNINTIDNWIDHVENILALTKDTDTIDTDVARIKNASASGQSVMADAGDTFELSRITTVAGDRVTINQMAADVTAGSETFAADTTPRNTFVHVEGEGLSHAVVLDFAKSGDQNLLNTSQYDQVRLTLTQGGAGAVVRISTQEVRSI
jgi:hypothetical protein